MFKNLAVLLMLVVLSGCAAKKIDYEPKPVATKQEAVALLERLLREQTGTNSTASVEVTNTYFATSDRAVWRASSADGTEGVSMQGGRFVYYDNIGGMTLYRKNKRYFVRVTDVVGVRIFDYNHHNRIKTEQFQDAVSTLIAP